ncbi:MAG: DNA polymerase III subunit gamma/tau [Planctomycetaceae bacterium]|nr:DNA polymerase III subunit gamma/tau [Planctomycetaceae bacterium]
MSNSLPADDSQSPPGEYVVVARRYRPQDFEQLVGQSQVSQALANAITTNRVGHAYLFTGARGVGKTSTARIFSKCLNCVTGPTTTPCGQCDVCAGIASGDDIDVIEIDGASNRGIDEIRQLRSNVNVRPSRARFKIYIIDEVHMLTTPAFNALLKTLEEPPEHVKFIFCTTEADKIPITVLSRCQRFDFAPIETRSIVDRLAQICANEGVTAEPEVLQIVARRAAGSMRDSQSLLEQLLSFGGKRITVDDVHAMLGTAKSSRLLSLVACLVRRDAAAALAEVEAATGEGVDLGQFTEQLLGHFRDAMAALVGCPQELLLHTSAAEFDATRQVGQQLGLTTLLAIAQILDQTLVRMRQSTHVRTLVEMALVRICKLEDLDALPALVAQLRDGVPVSMPPRPASAPVQAPAAPPSPAATTQKKTPDVSAELASSESSRNTPCAVPQAAEVDPANPPATTVQPPRHADLSPLDHESALVAWRQTLAELQDMTGDCASKFDSVAISAPNRLVVRFRKDYTTAKEFCERPDKRSRLEQTLSRLTGRDIRIDFAVLADESQVAGIQQVAARAPVNRRQRQAELQRHPLVRQAIEMFDAEIVTVVEPIVAEADGSDQPITSEPETHPSG